MSINSTTKSSRKIPATLAIFTACFLFFLIAKRFSN